MPPSESVRVCHFDQWLGHLRDLLYHLLYHLLETSKFNNLLSPSCTTCWHLVDDLAVVPQYYLVYNRVPGEGVEKSFFGWGGHGASLVGLGRGRGAGRTPLLQCPAAATRGKKSFKF